MALTSYGGIKVRQRLLSVLLCCIVFCAVFSGATLTGMAQESEETEMLSIISWEWIDEEGVLVWADEPGLWGVGLPGTSKEDKITKEQLKEILPASVLARLSEERTEELAVEWDFSGYPEEGAGEGGYIFNARLPEGYVLDENVPALSVAVELGGGEPYVTAWISDWNFIERGAASISQNSAGELSLTILTETNLSKTDMLKLLQESLPEQMYIHCWQGQGGTAPGYTWVKEAPSGDWGHYGTLDITWSPSLSELSNEEIVYNKEYKLKAVYDTYWGIREGFGVAELNVSFHAVNDHIVTDRVADPEGAVVNLFDYWVRDDGKGENPSAPEGDILTKNDAHIRPSTEPDNVDGFTPAPVALSGDTDWWKNINEGHLLIFGDGVIHAGLWNKGGGESTAYGKKYAGMENIVQSKLVNNYPAINTKLAREKLTGAAEGTEKYRDWTLIGDCMLAGTPTSDHALPSGRDYKSINIQNLSGSLIARWGKNIDTDTESLDYLFNPKTVHKAKKSYENVTGLFQMDKEGYYYYDMRQNFAEFVQAPDGDSAGHFTLYDAPATVRTDGEKSIGNFFPFNKGTQVFDSFKNGKMSSNVPCFGNEMNHHLGMTVDIQFRQPTNGKIITGKEEKPMTFEFSGDDDVWVFIDDVLVLDLGGVHSEIYGTIDFSTGDVYIGRAFEAKGIPDNPADPANLVTHTTLKKLYDEVGEADSRAWNGSTFASNSDHTLRMFYLERGNYDSSIALRFNLQPRLFQEIKKVDQNGRPIANVEFNLYAAQKSGNGDSAVYTAVGNKLAALITDADGNARFEEEEGNGQKQPFNFTDRYAEQNIQYYILREAKAPPGYRKLPSDIVLQYNPSTTMLTVVNRWTTGAFASFTNTISGNSDITYGAFDVDSGDIRPSSEVVSNTSQSDGLVVAIPFLYEQDIKKWKALYGSNSTGLHAVQPEDREVIAWRRAALTAVLHQCIDDGAATPHWYLGWNSNTERLEGTLRDLPGGADRYQINGSDGDMRVIYAVIEPEALDRLGIGKNQSAGEKYEALREYIRDKMNNGKSIDDAVKEGVDEVFALSVNGGTGNAFRFLNVDQFVQNFRSLIHIPNERRELRVWKIDQDGKGVNGAEFGLYNDELCSGAPVAVGTTARVDDRDGVLIFSPDAVGRDGYAQIGWEDRGNSRYYLQEIQAPAGHEVNDTVVPVIVGVYSIYADAGTADDGVTVIAGVGKLAQTMSQYAADEEVDITLRDITAFAQIQDSDGFSLDGWKDMNLSGTSVKRRMNLHYGMNAIVDYGLHDQDGGRSLYPVFVAETGFLRARVQQNYAALTGEMYGSTNIHTNKTNLGTTDITTLFSLENAVVVTDKTDVDTRTGQLTIKKLMEGKNLLEKDYLNNFTFRVTLIGADGQNLPGDYYFYGTDKSGYISSGGTIPLHHDDSITVLGLPEGTSYRVEEVNPLPEGIVESTGETGTIVKDENSEALFVNTLERPDNPTEPDGAGKADPIGKQGNKDNSLDTGDRQPWELWLFFLILSLGCIISVVFYERNKRMLRVWKRR